MIHFSYYAYPHNTHIYPFTYIKVEQIFSHPVWLFANNFFFTKAFMQIGKSKYLRMKETAMEILASIVLVKAILSST